MHIYIFIGGSRKRAGILKGDYKTRERLEKEEASRDDAKTQRREKQGVRPATPCELQVSRGLRSCLSLIPSSQSTNPQSLNPGTAFAHGYAAGEQGSLTSRRNGLACQAVVPPRGPPPPRRRRRGLRRDSLRPGCAAGEGWWARRDLNPQPRDYESNQADFAQGPFHGHFRMAQPFVPTQTMQQNA